MRKKRSSGFQTRSATNQAVQPHKMARGLKFWIEEEEVLYYPYSKNKGTAKLICVFVFAYAKCRFSHDEAHIEHEISITLVRQLGVNKIHEYLTYEQTKSLDQ